MDESESRPIFDFERIRREAQARFDSYMHRPREAKFTNRAKIRVVRDYLKVAEVGTVRGWDGKITNFTLLSDEAAPMGFTLAPRPLQYLIAGVGF